MHACVAMESVNTPFSYISNPCPSFIYDVNGHFQSWLCSLYNLCTKQSIAWVIAKCAYNSIVFKLMNFLRAGTSDCCKIHCLEQQYSYIEMSWRLNEQFQRQQRVCLSTTTLEYFFTAPAFHWQVLYGGDTRLSHFSVCNGSRTPDYILTLYVMLGGLYIHSAAFQLCF